MTAGSRSVDVGMTHVALPVRDAEASAAFYRAYAGMQVVHTRRDEKSGNRVSWISDLTRPFVLVLIEGAPAGHRLGGWSHVGVGCASRAEVDERCERARAEGLVVNGPFDDGEPVGYWAFIEDPDGHNLELSHGQEVGLAVADARLRGGASGAER